MASDMSDATTRNRCYHNG